MTDRDDDHTRPEPNRQPNLAAFAEALSTAVGGATRMTRARAKETAERLLTQAGFDQVDLGRVDLGGAAADASTRINQLADEILAARKANREQLQRAVATELDKSLARLGLARADEVAELRSEVAELRADVAAVRKQTAATGSRSSAGAATARKTAKAPSATSSTAKKSTAKKSTAKKAGSTSKKSTAKTSTTKKAATKKSSPTTSSGSKRTGAKKTTKKS